MQSQSRCSKILNLLLMTCLCSVDMNFQILMIQAYWKLRYSDAAAAAAASRTNRFLCIYAQQDFGNAFFNFRSPELLRR